MSPSSPDEVRRSALRLPEIALVAAAFGAGLARGATIDAVSDDIFHLLRVGQALLHGSLDGYVIPPGGEHAPLLGALAEALVGPMLGAVAFAISAALLAVALVRRGPLVTIFAVALLLLPPAFAFGTVAHPASALGGTLLLAAVIAAPTRARAIALATLASLATPVGLAAVPALAIPEWRSRRAVDRALEVLPVLLLIALVCWLSLALPEGRRLEIARGLFSGWGAPGIGTPSTIAALLRVWGEGVMLLATFAVAAYAIRGAPEEERLAFIAGAACMGGALLCADADSVRSFVPALAPLAALVAALLVDRVPDPAGAAMRRPILLATCVPIAVFLARTSAEQRHCDAERGRCERMEQITARLPQLVEPNALIASSSTGALAFHAYRPVLPLRAIAGRDLVFDPGLPRAIFFEKALVPARGSEFAVFRDPAFLRVFAPRLFRRGAHGEIEDAFWARRANPVAETATPPAYRVALARAWDAHARGRIDDAARAFAAAVAAEPEGLGIAREWSGMQEASLGRSDAARAQFEEAVARDPATARARGHLADVAISRGDYARADSLLAQSIEWNDDDAETWGTVARLAAALGDSDRAREASRRATAIAPGEARLRMNAGSLLWRSGETEAAKQEWGMALQLRPELVDYIGDFRRAKPGDPAPPLLPLFSLDSFEPGAPPRP